MHHGREHERERALAHGERIPLLDEAHLARKAEVIFQHLRHLLIGDDGRGRVLFEHARKRGGMIGLHVMHDDIVERPAAQRIGKIFKKEVGYGEIHRIEQHRLFVRQQIGIVRYPARHGIGALEERDAAVVPAEIEEIVRDANTVVHIA